MPRERPPTVQRLPDQVGYVRALAQRVEVDGRARPLDTEGSTTHANHRTLYGTTTTRLEMRVPTDRAELIREAVAARGESITGFVLGAATRAAEAALAFEHETLVPPDFFEQLLAALDTDDEIPAELQALGCLPRAFQRE